MPHFNRSTTRTLLLCGFIGPSLFVIAFLLQGLLRSDYNPLSLPVSALVSGTYGWVQSLNFLLGGVLVLLFSLGVRRASRLLQYPLSIALLFAAAGIGLIGAGIFPSGSGRPLDVAMPLAPRLHYGFSMLLYTGRPTACFMLIPHFRRSGNKFWHRYSLLSVSLVIVFFLLTVLALQGAAAVKAYAGLFQKLSIGFGFAWLAMLALHIRKRLPLARN